MQLIHGLGMTTSLSLKTLAKDSVIYGVAGVLLRSMSALLVPVFTRDFSPSEYGSMSIVLATVALINVFVVLALDNSAARWYYDASDEADRKETFATWAWTYLAAASTAGVIVFFSSQFLAKALLDSTRFANLFDLAAATIPAAVLGQVLLMWLRVQRRAWAAVAYAVWFSALTIGSTLVLVVGLDRGLHGVFTAQIIAGAGGSAASILIMRDWLRPKWFKRDRLAAMLRYALPLIPAALGF